ncbi:uncharacterized protein LOC108200984 [Daucus carota subsp. sativus]|uniref:uncharacterized protein LOC108200984 n=1 Tax=Daucus carota subsp. sativus TaxID=79200 RepID=UPI0007F023D9|nr:PREDICTED: uncharacterized protein LOC108200984 [Daucus carota subsp. sativus]
MSTSLPPHVALNPQAPEYFPSTFTYYVFFVPHIYPLTLYNINNYHAQPPPQAPHNQLKSQETGQSHQRRRFGGACSKTRFMNTKGYTRFERGKRGNKDDVEDKDGCFRVVQTCVMVNKRQKPVMPLEYGEENLDVGANITTVMIRNVPNKLTRDGLLILLDKHCMLMNEGGKDCGDGNYSAYDFVYLPIDFQTGVNKGYAFVNFTNKRGVKMFYNEFHNKAWDIGFKTPKICEVVCAKIQGREGLVKHFGGTLFICSSDEYLPVCFSPARDGCGKGAGSGRATVGEQEHSSRNLSEDWLTKSGNQFPGILGSRPIKVLQAAKYS